MLAEVKQLQHFTVRMYDTYISDNKFWMDLLCDLKCQSVEVLGNCPNVRAYMQEYRAKKAREDQEAEAEDGKSLKPSKRSKKVFKSEAIIHDD